MKVIESESENQKHVESTKQQKSYAFLVIDRRTTRTDLVHDFHLPSDHVRYGLLLGLKRLILSSGLRPWHKLWLFIIIYHHLTFSEPNGVRSSAFRYVDPWSNLWFNQVVRTTWLKVSVNKRYSYTLMCSGFHMAEPIVLGHKLVYNFIPGAHRCHNFVTIVVFDSHKSSPTIVKHIYFI